MQQCSAQKGLNGAIKPLRIARLLGWYNAAATRSAQTRLSCLAPMPHCGLSMWEGVEDRRVDNGNINLRAVQFLLGHNKMDSTVRYLGVELEDALIIAEVIEI